MEAKQNKATQSSETEIEAEVGAGNGAREFFVVAIGASAGGLEALEKFFDHMPPLTDFAFVIVQHLSPDYKSLMGELLQRHTTMQIAEAADGTVVQPGSVYLMPRKTNMTIYQGRLFLTEKVHGLNLPIDIFFRSLAEDLGKRAVGIILSGTGSDGTRGIRAIKEADGIVMVQSEESAKFDGMPRSAISTGIADYVLPVEQLPGELQNFTTGSLLIAAEDDGGTMLSGTDFQKIMLLIRRKTGVDLTNYKDSTLQRRIHRRMGIRHVDETSEYVKLLESNPQEITILFREMLIGVTKFFRDPEAFELLSSHVIPEIVNAKDIDEPIRVWVPGCSTGEEAYTIAMLLDRYCTHHQLKHEIKIFATDIDKTALETAAHGAYSESIAADASTEILRSYFVSKGERYHVVPRIREMVVFAYHNVFKDPPFRSIDLVSCRNLLIYLQPVLQKQVIGNFQFSLKRGGFLLLGNSETLGDAAKQFQTVDLKWKLFRFKGERDSDSLQRTRPAAAFADEPPRPAELRLEGSRPPSQPTAWHPAAPEPTAPEPAAAGTTPRQRAKAGEPVLERLIETAVAPCVVVNQDRELQHIFGDVSPYLRLASGKMNLDILTMANREIEIVISTALPVAIRERRPVSYSDVTVAHAGERHAITLTVQPLAEQGGVEYYAVIFAPQDSGSPSGTLHEATPFNLDTTVETRIHDLEHELQYTKENLQATIEELETSNEELQATNEELLSSNEELQSTNEELQSVNEELITVNAEYQKKIQELSELNDDMNNLLASSDIGSLFLDLDLRIRKFTPSITRRFNVINSDIGRPIKHLSHNLEYTELLNDIHEVRETQHTKELEVRTRDGTWMLLRIRPYISEGGEPGGIVISLIEISALKDAQFALQRKHELLMRVLDATPSPVTTVDERGRLVYCNSAALKLLGIPPLGDDEVSYADPRFEIADDHDNPIAAEDLPFARILTSGRPIYDYHHSIARPDGTRVRLSINGNPVFNDGGAVEGAVFSFHERPASDEQGC